MIKSMLVFVCGNPCVFPSDRSNLTINWWGYTEKKEGIGLSFSAGVVLYDTGDSGNIPRGRHVDA